MLDQIGFLTNRSTLGQIITIGRILEGIKSTLLLADFSKAFDSIHQVEIWKKLLEYGIPKEKVDAFMILYYKTPSVMPSSVRKTELLWHNSWRPLSGHIYLALFIFIICLEYVPKMQMKVQTKINTQSNNLSNRCWVCWWCSHDNW